MKLWPWQKYVLNIAVEKLTYLDLKPDAKILIKCPTCHKNSYYIVSGIRNQFFTCGILRCRKYCNYGLRVPKKFRPGLTQREYLAKYPPVYTVQAKELAQAKRQAYFWKKKLMKTLDNSNATEEKKATAKVCLKILADISKPKLTNYEATGFRIWRQNQK